MAAKHVVVFSHGFGVRFDDRGLFTNIAEILGNAIEPVLFDYYMIDQAHNEVTVRPISEQAKILQSKLAQTRQKYPEAIIDLVCHSQGCIIAAFAKPTEVRKTIFLAGPATLSNTESFRKKFAERPGAFRDEAGDLHVPRRDGTTTIVPADYRKEIVAIDPIAIYTELAETTELSVVRATEDEVLPGERSDIKIEGAAQYELPASHDFKPPQRQAVCELVKKILLEGNDAS